MDIWVVAAAAGYVAQHWKNFVKGRQSLSDSSCEGPSFAGLNAPSITQQVQDRNCTVDALHKEKQCYETYSERETVLQDTSTAEMASNSRLYDGYLVALDGDVKSTTRYRGTDLSLQPFGRDRSVSCGFPRKRSSLRSRRCNRQFIKPLSSLESCLMAQLYKEEAEMEEYTFSTICSPVVRPFLVTDGTKIIGRASSDSFSLLNRSSQNKPYIDNFLRGKTKVHGSSQGALLFGIGVSVGIMSSILAGKQEVEKLTGLLKQTENLVQDLQEELEMKDSLTVKELAVEDYESQDTQNETFNNQPLHAVSPEEKRENYPKEDCDQKPDEESLSKIEAELEAELERLELNMSSCKLEAKLSDVVELDPDDMPDMVKGELKANLFSWEDDSQPYADRDGSGSSTPHSVNYAVSPREVSLRLHEVIQSRLEQRIEELEVAFQNSERKARIIEAEQMSHWRTFSNSESGGTSSKQGSPVMKQHHSHAEQPVVINLSGDALEAYNEAYDEFSKMNELEEEEEETQSGVKNSMKQQPLRHSTEIASWFHNEVQNGSSSRSSFTERRAMLFPPETGRDNGSLSNDLISSGLISDDDHDEMEELLIKHIVEKAKKGSPAVLNAQKVLFSSDET